MVRMMRADLGRQGRGGVPALDPAGPGVRCSRDRRARDCTSARPAGRSARARRRPAGRRAASAGEYGPIAGSARSRASASLVRSSSRGLRLSSSTWQITAVSCSFAAAMVAPAGEHVADLPDGIVNRVFAEHAPGQRLAVEAADAVERGEPAQQVGVGEQIRACAGAHLSRPRLPELAGAGPDQAGPVLRGPRPVRPAQLGAPCQHQRGRVPGEPPLMAGIRVPVQRGPGVVERLHQPPDRPPGRRAQVAVSAPEQFQPESAQAVQLGHGELALPGVAFQVERAMARPERPAAPAAAAEDAPVTLSAPRLAARRGGRASRPARRGCGPSTC